MPQSARAYYLAVVSCVAAFMQGYDSGVAGGVLTMDSFRHDYRYSTDDKTRVNSLTVGLQQFGALLACFAVFPLTSRIGRRKAIMLSATLFLIGTSIETANTHSLVVWYLGRFISGLGQGGCSCVVPTYIAEMSPKEIRGRLGSSFQWMFTVGILCAYWLDYIVVRHLPPTSRQWQIPVGMQLTAGGLLLLGMLTLKESVRWLIKRGRMDEAWASLTWVRGSDDESVRVEFGEITAGVRKESLAAKDVKPLDLIYERANRFRVFLATTIFFFQQGTGATALAYFAPQFFQLLVGPGDADLLLTAMFGGVKVAACTIFIFAIADRFGRRTLLTCGGAAMAACMFATALLYKYRVPAQSDTSNDGNEGQAESTVTPIGIVLVCLIFLNVSAYNWSWGTIPWAYVPEIFPTRTREIGVAAGLASNWTFSFLFTTATPYMIRDLGWGTFLLYAGIDVSMVVFAYVFVKETAGKSLEDASDVYQSTTRPVYIEESGSSERQTLLRDEAGTEDGDYGAVRR